MSAQNPDVPRMSDEERARLRRAFELLPKIAMHGEESLVRHSSVLPEWIMLVVADPRERYTVHTPEGERRTVLTGRVSESRQWIMVVFVGDPDTGEFLTAYHNRQLEDRYGGRPWQNR